jgi:hypothetical protein
MKPEAEKWRDRYLLQRNAMDTIRRELGAADHESIIAKIREIKARIFELESKGAT